MCKNALEGLSTKHYEEHFIQLTQVGLEYLVKLAQFKVYLTLH